MSRLRAQKLPDARHEVLAAGWVVPEPLRCVQCGICSFNCPIDIDVRRHAWLDEPVKDSHCLTRLLLATGSHAINLRLPGVEIHYYTELAAILGKRGRVNGIRTADGPRIDCALVAVAIGIRSRIELAKGAGLATERGILKGGFYARSAGTARSKPHDWFAAVGPG